MSNVSDNVSNNPFPRIISDMKNKIISLDDYEYHSDHNMTLKLSDQVLLYNTGDQWKVVPLLLALSYPIIYDKHTIDDESYDVTIVVCPVTLRSVIFKGIFEFETYDKYTMILKEKDTTNLLPIDSGFKIDKKYVIESNKRSEVKIITLRSALIFAPDVKYMIISKKSEIKISPIIELSYYSNEKNLSGEDLDGLIHPKTLVYIIQYKSYVEEDDKTSIVLGKDVNKSAPTGYDSRKSKIFIYLNKQNSKIMNREGYVIPMLWWVAKIDYPISKVINVL